MVTGLQVVERLVLRDELVEYGLAAVSAAQGGNDLPVRSGTFRIDAIRELDEAIGAFARLSPSEFPVEEDEKVRHGDTRSLVHFFPFAPKKSELNEVGQTGAGECWPARFSCHAGAFLG